MKILNFKKTKVIFFTLLAVLAISVSGLHAYGQGEPSSMRLIYKNWHRLAESSNYVDVSCRVIQCEKVNQVQLKVHNENTTTQTLKFKIEILNTANGESFSKDIEVTLNSLQEINGACDVPGSSKDLQIDLPATYNPMQINTLITFKP